MNLQFEDRLFSEKKPRTTAIIIIVMILVLLAIMGWFYYLYTLTEDKSYFYYLLLFLIVPFAYYFAPINNSLRFETERLRIQEERISFISKEGMPTNQWKLREIDSIFFCRSFNPFIVITTNNKETERTMTLIKKLEEGVNVGDTLMRMRPQDNRTRLLNNMNDFIKHAREQGLSAVFIHDARKLFTVLDPLHWESTTRKIRGGIFLTDYLLIFKNPKGKKPSSL